MNGRERSGYADRVELLVGAVEQLSLARDVARVQEIVGHSARELSGADGATFVLLEDGECVYADEEAISPLWKGKRFPVDTCISGWSMLHHEHVVIEDIYADERIPHEAYRPTFVKSLCMVPIRASDPVGAIGTYWADHYVPSEEDIRLLRALADTTAVALEAVKVAKVAQLSHTDELTGLPNRRGWNEAIVRELARAKRLDEPLAVAILDLDDFKSFNDRHGHRAGDDLLIKVASAWREVLRPYDVIARYGGDEFVVALPGVSPVDVLTAIERLRAAAPDGRSCSAGVANWNGVDGPEDLLGRADVALYEAKGNGRNRAVLAAY